MKNFFLCFYFLLLFCFWNLLNVFILKVSERKRKRISLMFILKVSERKEKDIALWNPWGKPCCKEMPPLAAFLFKSLINEFYNRSISKNEKVGKESYWNLGLMEKKFFCVFIFCCYFVFLFFVVILFLESLVCLF